MKDYAPGRWGLSFIFSLEGSVFPKAMACALPNACLAVGLWYFMRRALSQEIFDDTLSGFAVSQVWSAYNWVIGFMVSFRASRAYSRWWEGGTLLQQARGEWFNAYSSLIAFCSQDEQKLPQVRKFQQTVSRLTSMLYASALMSIATESDLDFEIIDASGLSEPHLEYLRTQPDKCEIIMQWIQRLIVDNMTNGVLPIAPPVISRVFQELSRGIVNIHNVRKITEFQFPFPAAQMIVTMLMIQWCLTPIVAAVLVGTPIWAFIVAFFPIFACWGINYIAGEIEQPFGTDYNDMPMHFMQASMNTSILSLLDEHAQHPPDYDMDMENTQDVIAAGQKAPGENIKVISIKTRSVRYVTIMDPEQLNRVKHRFTQGRPKSRVSLSRLGKGSMIQKSKTSPQALLSAKSFWEEPDSSVVPAGSNQKVARLQKGLSMPASALEKPSDVVGASGSRVLSFVSNMERWSAASSSAKPSVSSEGESGRGVRFFTPANGATAASKDTDSKPPVTGTKSHPDFSPAPPENNDRDKRPPDNTPGVILLDA